MSSQLEFRSSDYLPAGSPVRHLLRAAQRHGIRLRPDRQTFMDQPLGHFRTDESR